jgi:hypothetical protein
MMGGMDECPSCNVPLTRIHDHTGAPTRETVCMACAKKAQAPLAAMAQPPVEDAPEAPQRRGKRRDEPKAGE